MLGSPLLGTAVGLVLLFTATALLCSGIVEGLSNLFQMRAKYLLTGMRTMLDATDRSTGAGRRGKRAKKLLHEEVKDPRVTGRAATDVQQRIAQPAPDAGRLDLTTALWDSPLLASLQSRRVGAGWTGSVRNPQYVSGRAFARALVDLLVPDTPDGVPPVVVEIGQLRDAVARLPLDQPVRRPLLAFLAQPGDRVSAFETAVEHWYDEQMAKITGWYKRWARVVLGVVGLVVACTANIDTVQVAHVLYVDAPVQQAVVATADTGALCQDVSGDRGACVRSELAGLQADGLPLGWAAGCPAAGARCWTWSAAAPGRWWDVPLKLLGWALTAFAVSFGAPFWFEALSRLGSLRNAGTRPSASTPG